MFYRSEVTTNPEKISIDSIDGEVLKKDIKQLVKLMVDDNNEKSPPLRSESFVVAVQGSWGTGKTWASWAFINHLKEQKGFKIDSNLHIFAFELLPFANINESVGNILGSIADRLRQQNITHVR